MQQLEAFLIRLFRYLDRRNSTFNTIMGVGFCILLGVVDLLTPSAYRFGFLYILSIITTTWLAGVRAGFLVSIISTAFLSRYYLHEGVLPAAWNILTVLSIFCIVTVMQFRIRQLLETESRLSRTDPLTGVMNPRAFSELAQYELLRLRREARPFSIAYLDIDDFKKVNDFYGHKRGDELLKALVRCLSQNLRRTDMVARVGGDEFVIFFPNTDQTAVKVVMQKVREGSGKLSAAGDWPMTISMGVVTFTDGVCDLDEIIAVADKLMYEVKKAGKNHILYSVHTANPPVPGALTR